MTVRSGVCGVAVALLALALTACSPTAKDDPLQTMTEAQARDQVDAYADTTAAALGSELTNYDVQKSACQGRRGEIATDGRFYMSGVGQIPVPAEQHVATLQRIRDDWAAQDYEILDHRTFPDGVAGVVAARNPTDRIQISLESTVPPEAFRLLVLTPCYAPPAGS